MRNRFCRRRARVKYAGERRRITGSGKTERRSKQRSCKQHGDSRHFPAKLSNLVETHHEPIFSLIQSETKNTGHFSTQTGRARCIDETRLTSSLRNGDNSPVSTG